MKKNSIFYILLILVLTSCDNSSKEQKSISQEDNSTVLNPDIKVHHQGERCLDCHGVGVTPIISNKVRYTSGATIYTKLDAVGSSYLAENYNLKLVLGNIDKTVSYEIGKGNANRISEVDASLLNGYTVLVVDKNNSVVNQSDKNSHDVSRGDCNACHTSSGRYGAPGRIVSFDTGALTQ